MDFIRDIFSAIDGYFNLGLDLSLPFFPTFTVLGWLVGVLVIVLRHNAEQNKQETHIESRWPLRFMLVYDIITMTFLAIGVGISLTILERVTSDSGEPIIQNCGEWTCQELIAGVGELQGANKILERELSDQKERNNLLEGRLAELVTRQYTDWMMDAARRILERRNDDSLNVPEASGIIAEEFNKYFELQ